jgi:hypothetical protein
MGMLFSLCLVISIILMIISPLTVTQGANAASPFKGSSNVDERANIPIAIPTPIPIETPKASNEDQVRQMVSDPGTVLSSLREFSASSVCNVLPVTGVTAIGDDGNVPSNVLDKNLNTRWSNLGQGSWIQLDLGSKKSICSVDIAWYRSNLRQNDFVISISDNGNSFTNKFTGTSSGITTSPEKYTMPAGTEGRYVRITVNGNTENDWASITEVAILGGDSGGDGTTGSLSHKWQTTPGSSNWASYNSLSGTVRANGDPAVIANADGRLEVFVVGTDNALWHRWQTAAGSSTWSQWTSLGGVMKADTSPVVARNSDGRLDVFVVGTNNQLYHKWQSAAGSSTWSGWSSLGNSLRDNGNPAVASNADGRLEVFVVQTDNQTHPPPPPDEGTNDKFGIRKIYPTKPGGEEWYMNMQDPRNDPRTSEPSMSKNADGSWRVTSGQVRYGVFTSSGYQPGNVVKDHSVIASRGYMQSPNDWKNVEMTGQVKYNSGGDDEWTWYARGGRHTGSGWQDGCEGVAYKGSLAYTGGDVRWAKEQWHVSYVFQPWKNSPADGDGKFVGFKVAIYNMQLNGKTVVKMESWVDPNNNNQWQKVYDFIDQGGWGSEGDECRGDDDQIVTWGGPIAAFRWDDGNSIDIKNLSVREIVPPS